ncbi:hypothetical protein PVT71_24680 (plasmid) [Salipiger sp. H15]|uniref:Transposase n=1 Tax=Alloyangia sp. H15 TaxID=3029062 RepID=A0AAU8ARD8_9RHOB
MLYNRRKRWSEMGVVARMFEERPFRRCMTVGQVSGSIGAKPSPSILDKIMMKRGPSTCLGPWAGQIACHRDRKCAMVAPAGRRIPWASSHRALARKPPSSFADFPQGKRVSLISGDITVYLPPG